MVDSAPHLYPSCNGDTIVPSLLRTSVQTARSVVQRRTLVQPGLLSRGSRGRVLNSSLPNPAWIAPEDLDKAFIPAKLVEDGLAYVRAQHADSGVPSEVQRALLEEACSTSELQATANLRGSRLAATEVDGSILVAHASGQIGELLCLSVLGRTPGGNFQGRERKLAQAAGSPILQLTWNQPLRGQDRLLLACRTSHWICVFEGSGTEAHEPSSSLSGEGAGDVAWMLKPVAAHQTPVRISHMAWNPQLPSLLGFVCEDGSLHMADADLKVGDARQVSLGGGIFPLVQAHAVDVTSKEPPCQKHARLVCEWGLHPLTLLLAAGPQLLRYGIRKPGAGCTPRPIHTLPEGDAFVALAPMCHVMSARQDRHLLAASTLHCIMLLDLRRPQQALLKWPHGSRREPPQLLSTYCAVRPEEAQTDIDGPPQPGPSQQRDTFLESTLQGSAADADDEQAGKLQRDVMASQYGSSSQVQGSQQPLSQVKLEHAPGMFGTQASQATPAEPLRNPMADAADPWPVFWHAGASEPPQGSPGPQWQSSAAAGALQGRICAASMGSGDVLLYSFACSEPEVEVHAWPPAGSQAGATSDASQPAIGSIKVTPMMPAQQHASQPGQDNEQQAQGSKPDRRPPEQAGQQDSRDDAKEISAGFTWRPLGMTATYAQGLPRRICCPLKATERVDAGLEGLAPDLAQQLEEVHREGPDLCGMAVVPPGATSGNQSAALLRLGCLGHVSAQCFADPMAQPDVQQAQQPPADALYDILPPSSASNGAAAALQSRRDGHNILRPGQRQRPRVWTEPETLCSMSGHQAIAQAALQGSGLDNDSAAEVPEQTREALSSLLQDTQVPLSLWELAQELGREGAGQRATQDLSTYRRRVGSILEGVPVIDYTTEGSRASRLQRWEKLQTDHEGLATARFQQALSEATAGNERPSSDPMRLRSAVADIAAAAIEGACGNKQALKLREGLSLPRRSTLADARAAAPSSSATQRMQTPVLGSQFSTLAATQSQGSPLVQQSTAPLVPLDRSCGAGDIIYPVCQSGPPVAAHDGSRPATITLHLTKPEVTDEAARSALKEMEDDWAEFEGRLLGKTSTKAPAPPRFSDTQTPSQGQWGAGPRSAAATEQPSGLRTAKRPGGPLGSQAKARKGSTAGKPSMPFEEGFS